MGGSESKVEAQVAAPPRRTGANIDVTGATPEQAAEAQEWVVNCAQNTFDFVQKEFPDSKSDLTPVARAAIAQCACTYPHMQRIMEAGGTQAEIDGIADGPCRETRQKLVAAVQALK
jgi:hypothetical protein